MDDAKGNEAETAAVEVLAALNNEGKQESEEKRKYKSDHGKVMHLPAFAQRDLL